MAASSGQTHNNNALRSRSRIESPSAILNVSQVARTQEPRSRSTMTAGNQRGTIITPTWSPYKWRVPMTWKDGAKYPAPELNQVFITNVDEAPAALAMLTEDFPMTDETWVQLTPLSWPVAANEIWSFTLVLHYWSASWWLPGWTIPTGGISAGTAAFLGTGAVVTLEQFYPSSGVYVAILNNPEGQTNPAGLVVFDIMVSNGTTAGTFMPVVNVTSDPVTDKLKMGSGLIGMRLSP